MQGNSFLLIPILKILRGSEGGISEHQLITALGRELDSFSQQGLSHSLALFQCHFLVMNALYQLQQEVAKGHLYLHISALDIYLQPMGEAGDQALADIEVQQSLREYYLDYSNLEGTSEAEVEQMLNGFWRRYLAADKQLEAFNALGLDENAKWPAIQQSYRRLVREHHPDKGGSTEKFMAVREAYEVLARIQSV